MSDFAGKVVLLAGGAGYLTVPVCRRLLAGGAAIMIADIREDRAATVVRELSAAFPGARIGNVLLDTGDENSIRNAVQKTVHELGALHVLVNATYYSVGKLVEEITMEEFDRALHVNVYGSFALAREAAKAMPAEGGSMVMFSSMYGVIAPEPAMYTPPMKPNPIEYGVSKAAIIQMVKYLAAYWGPRGIRVNAVVPGAFPHAATQADKEFTARLARKTVLGRIGRQDEVAGAVVFLASDEASYITGQSLVVDGGWTVW